MISQTLGQALETTSSQAAVNDLMRASIVSLFRDAVRVSLGHPATALAMLRMLWRQKAAARVRRAWQRQGLQVPPFMIVSVTRSCNLRCKGCYSRAQHRAHGTELTTEELRGLFAQARELGIGMVLLAGGEPLTRPELLDLADEYPDMMFVVFTNGLLLDGRMTARLARQRNVVPIISLEGYREETDTRRGEGVYQRLQDSIAGLRRAKAFFGASLTVTRDNYATITAPSFVSTLLGEGCKIFFYVEYVPFEPGTEDLTLTIPQSRELPRVMAGLRTRFPGLFIAFPGDEELFGGCLASGRGFIHVNPEGGVEPCPFAPFSDTSVRRAGLRTALQSGFLRTVRENHHLLQEAEGGCALWAKRDWVRSLLPEAPPAETPEIDRPQAPAHAGRPVLLET